MFLSRSQAILLIDRRLSIKMHDVEAGMINKVVLIDSCRPGSASNEEAKGSAIES